MTKAPPNPSTPTPDPSARTGAWRDRFEKILDARLSPSDSEPPLLHEAMRYSALAGGKRMRPLLVYAAGRALDVDESDLDGVACAIELIHTYSLIHDDLPAMDDDDLRRGHPTCHRRFDEATAILAGDALQAFAFEVLAADEALSRTPRAQAAVIREIARACGATGMAGGQVLDLAAVGEVLSLEALEHMHRLKTGALIAACLTAPAHVAGAGEGARAALARYGEAIGLAFQIHDDILDVTGSSERIGKTAHADEARHKPTFPALIGLDASRRRARELRDRAVDALSDLPGDVTTLTWLADYVIRRDR